MRMSAFEPGVTKTDERVTVVGASGYIGKAVVRECVRRGYETTAVVRDASKASFDGATIVGAECGDLGGISLRGGQDGRRRLLPREPAAKLKTEALAGQGDVTYSVVRPTAFFKSLSGQVEILKGGGPFVYFDRRRPGGEPIWNVGGPDAGISMKEQGELIATAIAEVDGEPRKEPWLLGVPIGVFDGIVGAIKWAYDLTGSPKVKDAWELGQIAATTPLPSVANRGGSRLPPDRAASRRRTRAAAAMAGYAPTELSKEKIERMFGTTGEVKQNNLPVVFFDVAASTLPWGASSSSCGPTSAR
ncbi:divinyl chlorophyllide a 8-vinyl-reductase [Aureococcus anophagefferens]|nr:divinyl chlorophyllide a 8-vinyl-reductase [Aureococcus anophagefferens]